MIASHHVKVSDLVNATGGTLLCGDADSFIDHVSSDSRELDTRTLFVPIRGEKFDGHSFVETLSRDDRVVCMLTERPQDAEIVKASGKALILCDNTLFALGHIARAYREKVFASPLVGITGTNGKTTTKELLASILASKYQVHKSEKNYNNEIGVPFALMGLSSSYGVSVIEMGMNHTGEIERLSSMARPTIGVITNAGEGHLEFLGSVENVARAKAEIVAGMRAGSLIVLNEESSCFDIMRDAAKNASLEIITVGIEKGMIRPESYRLYPTSTEVTWKGCAVRVPLYGIHNITNIMAALAVGERLGVDVHSAADALASFENVGKRSDASGEKIVVVNDTYNSNPLSLRYALRSLAEIYPSRRRIAILADMKELGDHAEPLHLAAGREVHDHGFSFLFTYGDLAAGICDGARNAGMRGDSIRHFSSKEDLIDAVMKIMAEGDALLVKGSRSMKMEEVADALVRE